MDIDECATYLRRTKRSIRNMVQRQQIPHAKLAGKLTFDRERIERWVQKKTRRAFD